MKKSLFTTGILFLMFNSFAQNYVSDSVYYTSILKPISVAKQTSAKDSVRSTIGYYAMINSGSLVGCKSCNGGKQITFSTSLIQGITFRDHLRLGFGVGLDSYFGLQAMPVFGSISWDLIGNKSKNAVVLQFNYGSSKPWPNDFYREYGYTKATGGRMVNPQIGYRIKYGDLKISLMVGHKYQRLTTHYEYPTYQYLFNGKMITGEPSRTTLRESFGRLAVTLGIGWN